MYVCECVCVCVCMCVCKSLSHVALFVTLWTVACQSPLSMGFSRQEYWSGLPFPSSGDLPNPGTEPWSHTLQADSFLSEPLVKPICMYVCMYVCTYICICTNNFFRLFSIMHYYKRLNIVSCAKQ